jgi:hypothetical protein
MMERMLAQEQKVVDLLGVHEQRLVRVSGVRVQDQVGDISVFCKIKSLV